MKAFELHYEINKPVNVVYDQLHDFKKFGAHHPYMTSVEIAHSHLPEFVEYKVAEEVYLFGFIKNYPRYTARVFELEKNRRLRYTSRVKKNISLTIEFRLIENAGGGCRISEYIEIRSNGLVASVFAGILKRSHAIVFGNIEKA